MKKKLVLAGLLSICIMFSVTVGNADAAPAYYTCTINAIGAGYGTWIIARLTDTGAAFTNKWFYLAGNTDQGKQMLATLLTASSLDKTLLVYTDHNTTPAGYPGPTIVGLLFNN